MDEVESVARAIAAVVFHDEISEVDQVWPDWHGTAQAAIAALDAARGDPVARVVEWLRSDKAFCLTNLEIAEAVERGEPFNG